MAEKNNNGAWIKWVLLVVIPCMITGMINNDRLRASEDVRIENQLRRDIKDVRNDIERKFEKIITSQEAFSHEQRVLGNAIIKIKTKMGID